MAGSPIVTARPDGSATAPVIRRMTMDDLQAVLALERAIYPDPWSEHIFREELATDGRVYLVAVVDGVIVGYAGLMLIGDDGHVTTVAVDRGARGHRLGTQLLLDLVERALVGGVRHLTLEVRTSNRTAQRLYTRFGMAPVGVRKDYYRDEDALIMWANDIDSAEYRVRLDTIRLRLETERSSSERGRD